MRILRRTRAFTLPEVLIVSLGIAILLVILFSMWSLFERLRTRTEVRLDRVAWFASAVRQLTTDLESVVVDEQGAPEVRDAGSGLTLRISFAGRAGADAGAETRTVSYRYEAQDGRLLRDGKPVGGAGQGSVTFEITDVESAASEPQAERKHQLRATFTALARTAGPHGTDRSAAQHVVTWLLRPSRQAPGAPHWVPAAGETSPVPAAD